MKVAVMLDSFRLPTLDERLDCCKKLGVDGAQLTVSPEWTDACAKDHLAHAKDKGIVYTALCGDLGDFSDIENNKRIVPLCKRNLDLSMILESGIVTAHVGDIPNKAHHPEEYEIMYNALREIAEYAKSIGAKYAMETGPEHASVVRAFLDDIGCDGIGVNLDPANLVMCSCDNAARAATLLGKYIYHTHAKDGIYAPMNPGRYPWIEVPLGQGAVHFDEYLPALHFAGYDGWLTIERECGDTPLRDVGLAVDYLNEMLKRYGY